MKQLGWCPRCRQWRVVVRVQTCTCGQGHKNIAQFSNCPLPKAVLVIRQHECGRRIKPIRLRDLEGIPA